jgi:shikimate kinase/3-dehydroquinate synthase
VASFVALAGFMGSGKSSIGRQLAAAMAWDFVDLDQEVEREAGATIASLFSTQGVDAFRAREAEVLRGVLGRIRSRGTVLALGGGALETSESRQELQRRGGLVLLDIDAKEAWARVAGSDRPLARDEQAFRDLWLSRRPTYEQAADWLLPAGGRTVDDLATEVRYLVELSGPKWQGLWGRRLSRTARSSLIIGGREALSVLGAKAAEARESGAQLHVITDQNVMHAWGERVLALIGGDGEGEALVLEPGESTKAPEVLQQCWKWLAGRKARREDVVVALGGGVVGDVAGFAAATYHRGIGLWQVPTSLVAQVDSSVGGKTAVNLDVGKNLVGAFYQPDLVVVDPATLDTLPHREHLGGLGEVVKHALLSSEEALASLEAEMQAIGDREEMTMSRLVKRNVWFKASVVEEDEREAGRRAILNLGHTTAHSLENVLGLGTINHGQAVALGLLVALGVSERMFGLDTNVRGRTGALLKALGLETKLELPCVDALMNAAGHDKKVRSGSSGFVGLRGVGEPAWGVDVPAAVFKESLEVIRR